MCTCLDPFNMGIYERLVEYLPFILKHITVQGYVILKYYVHKMVCCNKKTYKNF